MDQQIRDGLLILLDEAHISEGHENTWFKDNDPSSSICTSLDVISAERAAQMPPIGRNPIAGHACHLAAALEAFARAMKGGPYEIDWEASWNFPQPLDEAAWEGVRTRLRKAYADVRDYIAAADVKVEHVFFIASTLAHSAYHLGAIRQLGADVLPHSEE